MKKIKLTIRESLAAYRNAFYTAMNVKNGEVKPSDADCLDWLAETLRKKGNAQNMGDPYERKI